jgi:hypothetical protein
VAACWNKTTTSATDRWYLPNVMEYAYIFKAVKESAALRTAASGWPAVTNYYSSEEVTSSYSASGYVTTFNNGGGWHQLRMPSLKIDHMKKNNELVADLGILSADREYFGRIHHRTIEIDSSVFFNNFLKKLGYLSAVTTIRKKLNQQDPFQLPRVFINNDNHLFRLKLKLIGLKKFY